MEAERFGRIVKRIEPPNTGSILAIAAHPDDIESWCAGTLACAIDAGATVSLLLVTSGDKGSSDRTASPAEVAARREREAQEAAQLLGIDEVAFLRYPDGEVEDVPALRRELVARIRAARPAIVFTHDSERPYPPYLSHRDHRIVGRATLDAIYPAARDPLNFPELLREGLEPHAVREIWLFSSAIASEVVDIANGFDRKIAARLAHRSQTPDPAALRAAWRARAAEIGAPAGLDCAEAFTRLLID